VQTSHPPWVYHAADLSIGLVHTCRPGELVLQIPDVGVSRDSLQRADKDSMLSCREADTVTNMMVSPVEMLTECKGGHAHSL